MVAIIFIAAGMFLGMYQSFKLKRREDFLSEILQLLEEMSVQMKYRMLPVEQLIEEMSGGRFIFIDKVYEILKSKNNYDWRFAWEKAVVETSEINGEDCELLISVGKQLGNSDINGQLALLELNKSLFRARFSEAVAENNKKGKMYRSVGLLAGLGVAIIIL